MRRLKLGERLVKLKFQTTQSNHKCFSEWSVTYCSIAFDN